MYKDEYSRLMETCPEIDDKVIILFKKEFEHKLLKDPSSDIVIEIQKPEIIGELRPTLSMVYKEEVQPLQIEEIQTPVESKEDSIQKALDKMRTEAAMSNMKKIVQQKALINKNRSIIQEFITEFKMENSRKPDIKEVIQNLEGRVDAETITRIMETEQII